MIVNGVWNAMAVLSLLCVVLWVFVSWFQLWCLFESTGVGVGVGVDV